MSDHIPADLQRLYASCMAAINDPDGDHKQVAPDPEEVRELIERIGRVEAETQELAESLDALKSETARFASQVHHPMRKRLECAEALLRECVNLQQGSILDVDVADRIAAFLAEGDTQ